MTQREKPTVWGLASASEVEAALRGLGIALSTQDAGLKYTAGINVPISAEARDVAGLSDTDLYSESARDLFECKDRVRSSGRAESVDIRVPTSDGNWFRVWIEPMHQNGAAGGVITASVDINSLKTTEELLRLALLELAHRSKNLLAVVLSLARQSVDESATLGQFSQRFVGRVRALALAHDVLTDESWRGATVFSLVRSQLAAFSEEANAQSKVEGHNAYLRPNAVQYVGLALHELIAISVLSGALSTPDGRLTVTSALSLGEGPPDLVLTWHETDLPPEATQDKSAFGHALLEKIVPAALGGEASLDNSETHALTYRLRIPAGQFF